MDELWTKLTAPFPPGPLTAEMVMDRLDSVLNPDGWEIRLEQNEFEDAGMITHARLFIKSYSKDGIGVTVDTALLSAARMFGIGRGHQTIIPVDPPVAPAVAVPPAPTATPAQSDGPPTQVEMKAFWPTMQRKGKTWVDCMRWLNVGFGTGFTKDTRSGQLTREQWNALVHWILSIQTGD